jgi:hypothetical protein
MWERVMVTLLLITTISCTDALNIIHRLTKVTGLSPIQKSEIILEVHKTIPFCPVTIKKDDK